MGTNIFNMGILTAVIGFGLYRIMINRNRGVRLGFAGLAAWLATMAAVLFTSWQLWLSGSSRLEIVVPTMLGVHALIGIGEAIITVAAMTFIERTRPDLLSAEGTTAPGGRGWIPAGILVSLLAVFLSPLASADPDGLERVAAEIGFLESAQSAPYEVLPDYTIPIMGDTALSSVFAGIVGVLLVLGILFLVGRSFLSTRKS
jgi:cobalt/nickel transport system permease protein